MGGREAQFGNAAGARVMASFDPVGPYSLTRRDMVIASHLIAFGVAPIWFRLLFGGVYALVIASLIIGIVGDLWFLVGAAIMLCLLLVFGPALRSKKSLTDIVLRAASGGVEVENYQSKTLCKWPLIRNVRSVGQYHFLPIGVRIAFAIPRSEITAVNLAAFIAYVDAGIGAQNSKIL
jgi:hypothetical protein